MAGPAPSSEIKAIPAGKQDRLLFGRYEVNHLLGRGSFAKVYHARSVADPSSVVAVKVIEKSQLPDASAAGRVLREVAIMRSCFDHPNVTRLHELMATKSKIYLVMDYAAGGDLQSFLCRQARPLPEPTARRLFQQLVAALRFCHSRGVSHRDVKPQNLLLDGEGNVRLSDFGLSALPENSSKDGMLKTACGTPAFTAPEVLKRRGYDGTRADAWSCGVMLFVLLAGYLPFDDSNLPAMYKKVFKRELMFPPWISNLCRRLILRLLDPNPKTRMTLTDLTNQSWFKKSLPPSPTQTPALQSTPSFPTNAFDIISMSPGLDLSGLFEEEKKMESIRRFTTAEPPGKVVEKVEEMGRKLGCELKRGKWSGSVGLFKNGSQVVAVEVTEVTPSVVLVGLKAAGGILEDLELGLLQCS